MTIDVYPAHLIDNEFIHSDDWDPESTMNMANANFYTWFSELLGEQNVPASPGYWPVPFVANSLNMYTGDKDHRYAKKLAKIIAIAEITKARFIAYT